MNGVFPLLSFIVFAGFGLTFQRIQGLVADDYNIQHHDNTKLRVGLPPHSTTDARHKRYNVPANFCKYGSVAIAPCDFIECPPPSCYCPNGFTGSHCDIDVNECHGNPCKNGGRCKNWLGGYKCYCNHGFTGFWCETDIDDCASNPCKNNGTCIDRTDDVLCECVPGYSGHLCETMKMPRNAYQIGHTLVFDNVEISDSGIYTCIAQNKIKEAAEFVQITVKAKSSRPHVAPLIIAPAEVTVKYYLAVDLVCNVTGYPIPTVRWEYNQTVVGVVINGEVLTIPSVTNSTIGPYACIATNDAGTSRAIINLRTAYDSPKIITSPNVFLGNVGETRNFTCIATGYPKPRIVWKMTSFSNQPIQPPNYSLYNNGEIIEIKNIRTSGVLVHLTSSDQRVQKLI